MNRKPTPSILDDVLSASTAPTRLHIDQIKIDGGTQMRAALNEETVTEYLAEMRPIGWSQFPPIVAYYDGSDYWLADGFHRIEAYRRAAAEVEQDADKIPADVRAGTRREAILYAAGANAQHGLRRTNADKRRAVETLLRDDEWRQWSDRVIAHACAVDHSFVSRVRRSLTVDNPQSTTRTGADGRTINTARPAPLPAACQRSTRLRRFSRRRRLRRWSWTATARCPTGPQPTHRSPPPMSPRSSLRRLTTAAHGWRTIRCSSSSACRQSRTGRKSPDASPSPARLSVGCAS